LFQVAVERRNILIDSVSRQGCLLLCLIFFSTLTASVQAGFFYSEEVYTSQHLSNGYQIGDIVFFASAHWLYRKPKGIARFPDGGAAKALVGQTGFYCYDIASQKLVRLGMLDPRSAHRDVAYALFARDKDRLYIGYQPGGRVSDPMWTRWEIFVWQLERHRLERIEEKDKKVLFDTYFADSNTFWKSLQRVKAGVMSQYVKSFSLSQWQVPSPLDYCVKRQAAYLDDLVALKGDQTYRNAIINRLADRLGPEQVRKVL
jgi:hypothetical protein